MWKTLKDNSNTNDIIHLINTENGILNRVKSVKKAYSKLIIETWTMESSKEINLHLVFFLYL